MPKQTKKPATKPAQKPAGPHLPVVMLRDDKAGRFGSLIFLPADVAKERVKAGIVRRATDHDCAIAGFTPSIK